MWTFSNYPGIATTVVDFTNEFSPLLVGLIGLMVLSAGAIAFMSLRYHWAQRSGASIRPTSTVGEYSKAA